MHESRSNQKWRKGGRSQHKDPGLSLAKAEASAVPLGEGGVSREEYRKEGLRKKSKEKKHMRERGKQTLEKRLRKPELGGKGNGAAMVGSKREDVDLEEGNRVLGFKWGVEVHQRRNTVATKDWGATRRREGAVPTTGGWAAGSSGGGSGFRRDGAKGGQEGVTEFPEYRDEDN